MAVVGGWQASHTLDQDSVSVDPGRRPVTREIKLDPGFLQQVYRFEADRPAALMTPSGSTWHTESLPVSPRHRRPSLVGHSGSKEPEGQVHPLAGDGRPFGDLVTEGGLALAGHDYKVAMSELSGVAQATADWPHLEVTGSPERK